MTIVMKGNPAGGETPQDQQQQPGTLPVPPQQPPANPQQSESAAATEGEAKETDISVEMMDEQEPNFPVAELAHLDEMINRPRWVVPVLPKGELEVLLDASTKLCKDGRKRY